MVRFKELFCLLNKRLREDGGHLNNHNRGELHHLVTQSEKNALSVASFCLQSLATEVF